MRLAWLLDNFVGSALCACRPGGLLAAFSGSAVQLPLGTLLIVLCLSLAPSLFLACKMYIYVAITS